MAGAPVPVAVVSSRTEGDLIVGFLQAHGLTAAVVTDDAGGQEPQLQVQWNGVRVLVPPSDEAAARRLLDTTEDVADRSTGVEDPPRR